MPEPAELCCHGTWKVEDFGDEKEQGSCAGDPGATACYYRSFFNSKVRPGEAEDVFVSIQVMATELAAEDWVNDFASPYAEGDELDVEAIGHSDAVGNTARAWEYRDRGYAFWGKVFAFRRENVVAFVDVTFGTEEQMMRVVESIDEAINDEFLNWE